LERWRSPCQVVKVYTKTIIVPGTADGVGKSASEGDFEIIGSGRVEKLTWATILLCIPPGVIIFQESILKVSNSVLYLLTGT
jgi:hypothetical protein